MKVKFFIFDVGNVCYPYSLKPLNDLCRRCSAYPDDFESQGGIKAVDFKPLMLGEQCFKEFCKELCDYCNMEFSLKVKEDIDVAMHAGVGDFYPETLAAMEYLRNQGGKICLLSNALPNLAGTASELVYKKRAFVSYRLHLLKPDVRIYQKVLEQLKAAPEEVVFIDDKQLNVEAAQSLGIHGIVFQRETILEEVKKFI